MLLGELKGTRMSRTPNWKQMLVRSLYRFRNRITFITYLTLSKFMMVIAELMKLQQTALLTTKTYDGETHESRLRLKINSIEG